MSQNGQEFFIAVADIPKVLEAIKALADNKEKMSGGSYAYGAKKESWYSWVDTSDFVDAGNVEKALKSWRWHPEFDTDGNVVSIEFWGEKLGDDKVLFEAIAPWVKSGSYIEMQGEDGTMWRWCFDDGKFHEKTAKVSWE